MREASAVIVALCGGSGCGKTTLACWLARRLEGTQVQILSEDHYYRDAGTIPNFDPNRYNFDDVASKDHTLLVSHLHSLRMGETIACPTYDFATHTRTAATLAIEGKGLIVLEGMHVLQNAEIRRLIALSAYLDVPDDIRLARRLLRDVVERERSPQSVIAQYFNTVRPMHHRHVQPSRAFADLILLNEALFLSGGAIPEPLLEDLGAELLARTRALLTRAHEG